MLFLPLLWVFYIIKIYTTLFSKYYDFSLVLHQLYFAFLPLYSKHYFALTLFLPWRFHNRKLFYMMLKPSGHKFSSLILKKQTKQKHYHFPFFFVTQTPVIQRHLQHLISSQWIKLKYPSLFLIKYLWFIWKYITSQKQNGFLWRKKTEEMRIKYKRNSLGRLWPQIWTSKKHKVHKQEDTTLNIWLWLP